MSKPNVLIVEDDRSVGKLIANMLTARQIEWELVTDGLQALDHIAENPPRVIILDLALPVVDGWEVLNTLQQAERSIPVIVVTAHGQGDGARRARELGVRRFFEKPFVPSQLAAAVVDLLDSNGTNT